MIKIITVLCSLSLLANCHEQTVTTSDFADVSMQSCLMGTPQLAEITAASTVRPSLVDWPRSRSVRVSSDRVAGRGTWLCHHQT